MHRNLAAHFDAGLGITAAGGFASQWADLSGNGRHLLQASAPAKPIHLPFGVNNADTAAAGSTATTLNLAASALAINDAYNDMTVTLTGGTGKGQARTITDYVGATKVATVAAWDVTPDDTTTYSISASRPSLLFDGAAHFMKTAAFTFNQPNTIYFVGKQITWGSGLVMVDGNTLNAASIGQFPATPQINLYAGAGGVANGNLAVGARGVIGAVFNGASSRSHINATTVATGNVGSGNPGAISVGAGGNGTAFSNIQANELIAYNGAHDAATSANIIRALMNKWGIP